MYMSTSAAPVFPQEEYPRKKRPRPRPQLVETENNIIRVREKRSIYLMYILLCIAITVSLAIGLLSIYARKSELKAEINKIESLTQRVNASTERVEMMINATTDLDAVRETATTKLGMQPAAPYQIVKINVVKDSYTIQYDDQMAEEKNKSLLNRLVSD